MKITLYLVDKIKEFILPTQISGGFSFDANDLEENKLINIEAKDNSWVLYSTDDIFVIDGNNNNSNRNNSKRVFILYITKSWSKLFNLCITNF